MSLIPWRSKKVERIDDPPEPGLARVREEMEDLFERFFRNPFGALSDRPFGRLGWAPQVDLAESADDVAVKVELPGVDPKEVQIEVSGNMLSIRGEKREEKEEKKRDVHYVERSFGSFHRSVQLPNSVDSEKVDATFKDGVLTVRLAKRPEAKPKRITVKHA